MFEPKLAAERKVSFERDGLDASKACHISARGNVRSRAAGSGIQDVHLIGAEVSHEREIPEAIGLCECGRPVVFRVLADRVPG
jgi:hypothetical protein